MVRCEYEFVECERENGRAKKLKLKEGAYLDLQELLDL